MIIEQHYEKDGIRFILQLQTKNALTHKLLSESDKMQEAAKAELLQAAPQIFEILFIEMARRNLS